MQAGNPCLSCNFLELCLLKLNSYCILWSTLRCRYNFKFYDFDIFEQFIGLLLVNPTLSCPDILHPSCLWNMLIAWKYESPNHYQSVPSLTFFLKLTYHGFPPSQKVLPTLYLQLTRFKLHRIYKVLFPRLCHCFWFSWYRKPCFLQRMNFATPTVEVHTLPPFFSNKKN